MGVDVSKINAYSILTKNSAQVGKLNAYTVWKPKVDLAQPPGWFCETVMFTAGTDTAIKRIAATRMNGVKPKLAIFHGGHSTSNADTVDFDHFFGVYDGTTQRCITAYSLDNQTTTNTMRRRFDDNIAAASNTGIFMEYAANRWIADGMWVDRVTFNSNRTWFVTFFWGADFDGKVFDVDLGSGTSAIGVTGMGFEPNVLIGGNIGVATVDTITDHAVFNLGAACNAAGGIKQMCNMFRSEDAIAAGGQVTQYMDATRFSGEMANNGGTPAWSLNLNSFDSDGFTVTPSASTGGTHLIGVAIRIPSGVELVDFSTPTATGAASINGAGFTPGFAFTVHSSVRNLNTQEYDSDDASGLGVGWVDDGGLAHYHAARERNVDSSDSSNRTNTGFISVPNATQINNTLAAFSGYNADGVDVNYSAVNATARRGFMLFFQDFVPESSNSIDSNSHTNDPAPGGGDYSRFFMS